MTTVNFTKMHGTGNDYIYIECLDKIFEAPARETVAKMCDRHFGIGGDGVVFIVPSLTADFGMRMFNADGSEAEMCGNAVRCIAKYLYDRKKTNKTVIDLETKAGVKRLQLAVDQGSVKRVRVDMGRPLLEPSQIPVVSSKEKVVGEPFRIEENDLAVTCVSMGNPHAVFFVGEITDYLVHGLGPLIEVHPFFPAKTNVEFVQVIDRNHLQMRVWERGSGETLSCGTGACACVVAGVLNGLCERVVTVSVRGGDLRIEWPEAGNVFKSGPAEFAFDGTYAL